MCANTIGARGFSNEKSFTYCVLIVYAMPDELAGWLAGLSDMERLNSGQRDVAGSVTRMTRGGQSPSFETPRASAERERHDLAIGRAIAAGQAADESPMRHHDGGGGQRIGRHGGAERGGALGKNRLALAAPRHAVA